MRMWCAPARGMCRPHLLGEHVELHMIVGALNKGQNLQGFYDKGLIDTRLIIIRHADLANEMERRGYTHRSPLQPFADPGLGHITKDSFAQLTERCRLCSAG